MNTFEYLRAASMQDAIKQATAQDAQYLAGGTELLNWMRLRIVEPGRLVDIGFVPDQGQITRSGGDLIIGALATLDDVGRHELVTAHAQTLGQACLKAASPQVRNRATLGGNVLQKTRCVYFRSRPPFRGRATSAIQARAALRSTQSMSVMQFSAGPTPAWRCIPPIRWWR